MYNVHKKYLNYLSNNLGIVGLKNIEGVLVEPEWRNQHDQLIHNNNGLEEVQSN